MRRPAVRKKPPPPPLLVALLGLVTAVAALLVCTVQVRSMLQGRDFPLLRLHDPAHALFAYVE